MTQRIIPYLTVKGGADAIAFYAKAFGAIEAKRQTADDGKRLMHAVLTINGGTVMLADEFPDWGAFGPKSLKGSPVTIHLYVEDVDSFVTRAAAAVPTSPYEAATSSALRQSSTQASMSLSWTMDARDTSTLAAAALHG